MEGRIMKIYIVIGTSKIIHKPIILASTDNKEFAEEIEKFAKDIKILNHIRIHTIMVVK